MILKLANRVVVGILFANLIVRTNSCSCVFKGGNFEAVAECKNSAVEERDLLNILPKFKLCHDNLPSLHVTWKWVTNLHDFAYNLFFYDVGSHSFIKGMHRSQYFHHSV
jgi:hypothetical protein